MVVSMAVSMVFSLVVVISPFGYEVRTFESRSLSFVTSVFPLTEFPQLRDLIASQPRRQRFDCHIGPWAAVSRSPEPMAAVEIIVVSAEEKDVIGNTYRHVHLRLRH